MSPFELEFDWAVENKNVEGRVDECMIAMWLCFLTTLEQCVFFVGTGFETSGLSEALSSQFSRVPFEQNFRVFVLF